MRKVGKQWLGTRGTTGTPATYINRNSFLYKLCKPLAYVYASYAKLHVHRRLSSLATIHFIPPVPEVGWTRYWGTRLPWFGAAVLTLLPHSRFSGNPIQRLMMYIRCTQDAQTRIVLYTSYRHTIYILHILCKICKNINDIKRMHLCKMYIKYVKLQRHFT